MDVAAWANERGCLMKLLHPPVIDEVRPYVNDDRVAREEFTNASRRLGTSPNASHDREGDNSRCSRLC